jgi:hypothetical protein
LRAWLGSRILAFRGLLDVHSRYGLHARGVAYVTLSIEGFNEFVTSSIALIASGRATDWPGGIRTRWRSPTFTAYRVLGTRTNAEQNGYEVAEPLSALADVTSV